MYYETLNYLQTKFKSFMTITEIKLKVNCSAKIICAHKLIGHSDACMVSDYLVCIKYKSGCYAKALYYNWL